MCINQSTILSFNTISLNSLKSSFLLKLSPSPSTNTTVVTSSKRSSGSQLTLARRIRSDDRMNNNNFKEPKKKTLRQLGTYPFNENQGSVCSGPGSGGAATGSSTVYPNVRRSTRLFTTSHNNLIKENTKETKSSKYSPQKSQITRRSKPKTIRATSNLNSNTNNNNNTKATKSDDLFDKNDNDNSFNKSTDSLPAQCDDNSLLKICKQNVDNLVQLLKVLGNFLKSFSICDFLLRVRFVIFSIFNLLRICNRKKYMSNFYWSLLRTYMTTR